MDAKVTVTMAHDGIKRTVMSGAIRDRTLSELLAAQQYILAAESQIAEAMSVLAPSMPESGLVDACRQVKQAAISEADNARKLEAQLAERDARTADLIREFVHGLEAVTESSSEYSELGLEANDANQ